jgi:hypothetical protein
VSKGSQEVGDRGRPDPLNRYPGQDAHFHVFIIEAGEQTWNGVLIAGGDFAKRCCRMPADDGAGVVQEFDQRGCRPGGGVAQRSNEQDRAAHHHFMLVLEQQGQVGQDEAGFGPDLPQCDGRHPAHGG